jgi:hypothetical protein
MPRLPPTPPDDSDDLRAARGLITAALVSSAAWLLLVLVAWAVIEGLA